MTFIITLLALIVERFFDWSHLRQWSWFNRYQTEIFKKLSKLPPVFFLILSVVPILLLALFLDVVLTGWLFNFLKLIFGALVLIYCLGPRNFWADAYSNIKVLHTEDAEVAAEKIKTRLKVADIDVAQSVNYHFTRFIFIKANRRVFAVFFWFLLLGPIGALFYRLTSESRHLSYTQKIATDMTDWLDWLPVRVFALLFALAGNFTKVIQFWRAGLWSLPIANDRYLTQCGIAALDADGTQTVAQDGSAEKEALSLLDRTFVIALVILAFVVLIN